MMDSKIALPPLPDRRLTQKEVELYYSKGYQIADLFNRGERPSRQVFLLGNWLWSGITLRCARLERLLSGDEIKPHQRRWMEKTGSTKMGVITLHNSKGDITDRTVIPLCPEKSGWEGIME